MLTFYPTRFSSKWRIQVTLPPELSKVACVVDGFEVKVYKPRGKDTARLDKSGQNQKFFFSVKVPIHLELSFAIGKTKQYAKNFLLITALDGTILLLSKPYEKSPHDQGQWKAEKLRNKFVGKPYGVLFDAGFTPNTVEELKTGSTGMIGFCTLGEKTFASSTTAQQNMSHLVSSYRLVIEETIGRMKKWRILSNVFRRYSGKKGDTTELTQIVRVIATLTNRSIKLKPLREKGWESPYSIRIRNEKLPLASYPNCDITKTKTSTTEVGHPQKRTKK